MNMHFTVEFATAVTDSISIDFQEAQAFSLYNKALGYQRQGEHQRAEDVFHDLLAMSFVRDVNILTISFF